MGAKTCFLAYADGDAVAVLRGRPELDRTATQRLVATLFPSCQLVPDTDANLAEVYPLNNEIYAGCFPGLSIVSAKEFAPDKPSTLPAHFLKAATGRVVYLHAMHSVVDWFAYAIWRDGQLVRSLSVSPDSGVIEDIGERRPFEAPFWSGDRSVDTEEDEDRYPLRFHPLDFGEEALLDLFGFQIEGADSKFDPFEVPMCSFRRRKKWWKIW